MVFIKKHKSPLARLAFLLSGVAFAIGVVVVAVVVQFLETHFLPVKTDNAITYQAVIDDDLWVTGTSIKLRNCQFVPPVRARTESGQNLYIVSHNKTATVSWMPGEGPQNFGPWQIVNAKGHTVTIFQEFECHPFWNQFVEIAKVDAK